MKPRNLDTLVRWMARGQPPIITNVGNLFAAAFYWRFKRHDEPMLRMVWVGFVRYGQIPHFVEDFVQQEVYPHLVVKNNLLLEAK